MPHTYLAIASGYLILTVLQQIYHDLHLQNSCLQSWKLGGGGTIFIDYSVTELPSEIITYPAG